MKNKEHVSDNSLHNFLHVLKDHAILIFHVCVYAYILAFIVVVYGYRSRILFICQISLKVNFDKEFIC